MTSTKNPLLSYKDLLSFYYEAGVHTPILENPIDRFTQTELLQQKAASIPAPFLIEPDHKERAYHPQASARLQKTKHLSTQNAREMAMSARNLAELAKMVENFTGCSLRLTAKSTCFGQGPVGAPLMLIGAVPEREEDIQAIPFVGRGGQLLNKILAAIGIARQDVYVTHIVPWRPPGNRAITPMEAATYRPFLERQIQLVTPRLIVALGGLSMLLLTGHKNDIIRARGKWLRHKNESGLEADVMPTFEPNYLLRTPSQKKFVWHDFLSIKSRLEACHKPRHT